MPTNLGTIGAGGAKGVQDELQAMLAERMKQALDAQAEAVRQKQLAQKDTELKQQAERDQEAIKSREATEADRRRQSEALGVGATIDNAGGGQNLTGLVNSISPDNPVAQRYVLGLRKAQEFPTIGGGDTVAGPDTATGNNAPGMSTQYYKPEPVKPVGTRAVQTIDAQGNPIIRIVPDVAGSEFPDQPKVPSPQASQAEYDRSYALHLGKIDALKKPISDRAERLSRLNDTLNAGSPVADSVIAPELITSLAGGLGSGVRVNQAEIDQVVGGRNHWQSLKAALDKWTPNADTTYLFTPEQRVQMKALIGLVASRSNNALDQIDSAGTALSTAATPAEHRKIYNDLKLGLSKSATSGIGSASKFKAGDPVMYNGQKRTVQSVNPDGTLVLAPVVPAGGRGGGG